MFHVGQEVVRKSIANGIRRGRVIYANEKIISVDWDSGRTTSIAVQKVLLATSENLQALELKRLKSANRNTTLAEPDFPLYLEYENLY